MEYSLFATRSRRTDADCVLTIELSKRAKGLDHYFCLTGVAGGIKDAMQTNVPSLKPDLSAADVSTILSMPIVL